MAKKKKYYVVWKGAKPGVYQTWAEASAQVTGFPDAKYKSFLTAAAAQDAFRAGPGSQNPTVQHKAAPSAPISNSVGILKPSLSVDAACSGNPGKMEYQGVSTASKKQLFHQAFPVGTNNIGEFLALVHGLAFCKAQNLPNLPIYSDSKIAMGWIHKKKCKTTLKRSPRTVELLDLVTRGEQWLHNNAVTNPLLKWETKKWGEIPADFGRK